MKARPGAVAVAEVVVAAALALVAFAADSAIFTANLREPTCYLLDGDSVFFSAMHFKGILENGSYLENPYLGAPWGCDLHDFPAPDVFYLLAIKIVGALTHDWALTWNLLIIASYPLAAAAAYVTMRRFGVRFVPGAAASVLFALIPFHQLRIYGHTHLGMVYVGVPLASIPALEILRGSELMLGPGARRLWRLPIPVLLRDRRSIGLLVLAALTGLWGYVYFTIFALLFTLLAGAVRAGRDRKVLPLLRGAVLAGATGALFVVQNAGVIAFLRANGRVPIGERMPSDAEMFGLKIVQLLLPLPGHRFEPFRRLRTIYDATAPLANENGTATLGVVGAIGFLVLLFVLLRGPGESEGAAGARRAMLWPLAILSAATVLLGTIGGFGSLVAYFGFPDIRSYNRISVFTGFYGLFAVAVLADAAADRLKSHAARAAGFLAVAVVTVLGVYDQTYEGSPDYDGPAKASEHDRAFVNHVEAALPEGAMIFQVPYMQFPEGGPRAGLADYTHLMPYLYSKKLRWSYGAMRGRIGDDRYRELALTPLDRFADEVTIAGYQAVWVDPRGFEDGAKALFEVLGGELGVPTVKGPNGILIWSLAAHEKDLRERLGDDFDRRRKQWRERPYFGFNDGFYWREGDAKWSWYSARSRVKIFVTNPSDHTQKVVLSSGYRTAANEAQGASLWIDGLGVHDRLDIGPVSKRLDEVFEVPPGTHLVTMRTDAKPPPNVPDWRTRAFTLENPQLRTE